VADGGGLPGRGRARQGRAAIELEQTADPDEAGAYRAGTEAGEPFCARGGDLIGAAAAELAADVPRQIIAARFHNGLAALIEAGCVLCASGTA
jgi:hydrogenase maturation protein HypF